MEESEEMRVKGPHHQTPDSAQQHPSHTEQNQSTSKSAAGSPYHPCIQSVLQLSDLATGTAVSAHTSTGKSPFSSNTLGTYISNMILGLQKETRE